MLSRLSFQNLKALRKTSFPLRPFSVLVGPNGVGKTTVLEGVELLSLATQKEPEAPMLLDGLRTQYAAQEVHEPVSICAYLSDFRAELSFDKDWDEDTWKTVMRVGDGSVENVIDKDGLRRLTHQQALPFPRVAWASLRPEALGRSSLASRGEPSLSVDGLGLPTFLQHILTLRDGSIEQIEADLRQIVPSFHRVVVKPTEVVWWEEDILTINGQALPRRVRRAEPGYALSLHFAGVGIIPAMHISEGTLIALGLLAILHGPNPPQILLIDDIDRALHPAAQQRLVRSIRAVLERQPKLQILATTHSPDLVDSFQPEEVLVMGSSSDRGTVVRCLSEHPEAQKWLKLLRVGEFWSSVGEDWVSG